MIGISSYAFVWRSHASRERPLDLEDMIGVAAELGCEVFQVCDEARLEAGDAADMRSLFSAASGLGVVLETGTRGVEPDHLLAHLERAQRLGSTTVRSMLSSSRYTPTPAECVRWLRRQMPAYEAVGVTLALETYEQFATSVLVDVVNQVGSPNLGICLDPGNCVGGLEHPRDVVRTAAPYVVNHHVKDFAFRRSEGNLGFVLEGMPLGEGLLDHPAVLTRLAEHDRVEGISRIIEHWINPPGSIEDKAAVEGQVVADAVTYLRSVPVPGAVAGDGDQMPTKAEEHSCPGP